MERFVDAFREIGCQYREAVVVFHLLGQVRHFAVGVTILRFLYFANSPPQPRRGGVGQENRLTRPPRPLQSMWLRVFFDVAATHPRLVMVHWKGRLRGKLIRLLTALKMATSSRSP